ncbi:MAG: D-alanine--D-alanine ligase family protein [Chloroflexota bacterium]
MTGNERPSRKYRVGVVFGGRSAEHDVSLRSAETIMCALKDVGHDVLPIGVTREGRWLASSDPMAELQAASPLYALQGQGERQSGEVVGRVEELSLEALRSRSSAIPAEGWQQQVDVIFPALHGPMGEDGTIQGLFELAGVPYVGAGVMASSVAMDKAACKRILSAIGIPQTEWITILRRDWERDRVRVREHIESKIGYPCFVKPANLGSSVGITKVHGPDELEFAMAEGGRHDRRLVVERGVDGREFEVSVLGNDDPMASIVGEIVPGEGHEFYDFEAKYVDDTPDLIIPADIPDETQKEIQDLAIAAFREIDCAGIARVDFFVERDTGRVLLNEINTIPGFTSISMYPKLWEASGIPLADLVARLVDLALERFDERQGV